MTVYDIIKQFLVDHGYDGLCNDCCACGMKDLFACEEPHQLDCSPGYLIPCNGCTSRNYCLSTERGAKCEYEDDDA